MTAVVGVATARTDSTYRPLSRVGPENEPSGCSCAASRLPAVGNSASPFGNRPIAHAATVAPGPRSANTGA
jgi:hypothetical protein